MTQSGLKIEYHVSRRREYGDVNDRNGLGANVPVTLWIKESTYSFLELRALASNSSRCYQPVWSLLGLVPTQCRPVRLAWLEHSIGSNLYRKVVPSTILRLSVCIVRIADDTTRTVFEVWFSLSPMQPQMTEVIAVRRFWWEHESGPQLLVTIGKPTQSPNAEGEFYCPIKTSGFGNDERIETIFGVDAFQALELAIRYVGHRLSAVDHESGGRLRWEFGDDGRIPKEWEQNP